MKFEPIDRSVDRSIINISKGLIDLLSIDWLSIWSVDWSIDWLIKTAKRLIDRIAPVAALDEHFAADFGAVAGQVGEADAVMRALHLQERLASRVDHVDHRALAHLQACGMDKQIDRQTDKTNHLF